MKRLITIALALVGALMLVLSCEKAPFVTMTGPRSFTFTRDGGTQSFIFTCNRDWSVSSSESWIRVSPSSGAKSDNEVTVTITCSSNTTYDSRNASITVRVEELTETISVTQETGLGLLVSPTTFNLTNAAQDIEIEVQKNVQYAVTIDEACKNWISQKGTKGLSSEKVTFSVAANDSYDNREGKITFKQTDGDLVQTVTVKQSQTSVIFVKGEKDYTVSREGETVSVELQTNVDLEVLIPDDSKAWLSLVETKALVDKTLKFLIAENETYFYREAVVILKDKASNLQEELHFLQKQTDALFISEATESHITKDPQNIELTLFHNVDYSLVATTVPSWAAYDTEKIDDYTTKYIFKIGKNTTYTRREAELIFKATTGALQDKLGIIQEPTPIVYADKEVYNISKSGASFSIIVYSNVSYTIDKPDWLNESSVTQNEDPLQATTYTYSVEPTETERTGSIIYHWTDGDTQRTTEVKINQRNVTCSVNLTEAGTLLDAIGGVEKIDEINELIVSGPINGTDIIIIKRMTNLIILDLGEAKIVPGGQPFAYDYCTETDVIGFEMFLQMNFESFVFPKEVKHIGVDAFFQCRKLQSANLPSTVVEIDVNAFEFCFELKDLNLKEGLKRIGKFAFSQCPKLSTVTIPSSVEYIGDYAFANDTGISEVHVKAQPSTISVSTGAFNGIYDSAVLYVPKGTKDAFFYTELGNFKTIIEE